MKIGLFIPCHVDQLAPETGWAAVHILERLGHEVIFDRRQTCCGQAAFNSGFFNEARELAVKFLRIFGDYEVIVAPSGSCISMVKNHYEQLDLSGTEVREWESLRSRVWELTSFLVDYLKVTDVGAEFPHTVSIHHSCHALRDLGIKKQPLALLQKVKNLQLIEGDWDNECCGFGGVFSLKYPELANRISDRRADTLAQGKASYITGVDDSCLINLHRAFNRNGHSQKTIHIAQILDTQGGSSEHN